MLTHNEMRIGKRIEVNEQPWIIVDAQFVKPGKGQAFTKIKIKNLLDGRVIERTFKSSETVPLADVQDKDMQYLYDDGELVHFMDPSNYEQAGLDRNQIGETIKWLKEQEIYQVTTWRGKPVFVTPPAFVVLAISQCDPGIKGDTVSGATKNATLETGANIKVPLFVNEGDLIKVDTRTGDYVERAKK